MTVEGYKHFIDAQSMSAFDVNAFLMSQAVTRFDTAADRDAALEQVVTEGMVSYNKDTGELQLYDGSAWQTVAIEPIGAAGSDGQIQYNNGGVFAGSSSLTFNNATGDVTVGGRLTAVTGQFGGSSGDAITIGNDSKLVDVNIANTLGVYGLQDSTVASIKLGSGGGILSGSSSRIGINDTSPSYTLDVNGTGRFTGDVITAGSLATEGPDGGMAMRVWQANGGYGMIGTSGMSGSEYSLLTNGTDTFLSGGAGGSVFLRGPANGTAIQLINNGTNLLVEGGDSSGFLCGPNSTWGAYLFVGSGTDKANANTAAILSTDGNLHIDVADSKTMYLNYYSQGRPIWMYGDLNMNGYSISLGSGSSAKSFASGSNYWRPQDAYGNSYFDINSGQFYVDSDTYYFRNRASANSLVIDSAGNGTFTGGVYTSNWFRTYGEEGLYSQSYGQHFYPDSGGFYWDIDGPLRVRSGYEGGIQGYVGFHDANGFGLLHSGGAWWLNTQNNDAHLVIGGSGAYNPYNSVTGRKLMFGGGDSNAQGAYYIGTNLENYGGNYNKLDLRWHTGIRMGARAQYGGIRMYDSEAFGSVIFSVGETDANVRVTNTLFIGGHAINAVPGSGNPYGSINVGGAMQWDGYAIDQRFVFMYEGATRGGIYDDASNEWHVESTTNAQTNIMHNGSTRVQTENNGAYIAGKLRAYKSNTSSAYFDMQLEALAASSNGQVAGMVGHVPGYLAPTFRVWTGTGEGFDSNNYLGSNYAYVGGSSFITRSSERWKKNIRSRTDDEIIPTALALLSCRTVRWDDTSLDPVYCEEQMCLVQPDMCDDPNCECDCCAAIKNDPIQDRHFNRRGYIVEELAEVFPDAIHYEQDGQPSGIDYSVVTAELIDIVKLLVLQCDTQEQRIAALEGTT